MISEGVERGQREGFDRGQREAVRAILAARGIPVDADSQAKIEAPRHAEALRDLLARSDRQLRRRALRGRSGALRRCAPT